MHNTKQIDQFLLQAEEDVRRGPLACFLSVGSGEQEQRAEKRGWEGHKGMTVQLMVVLEVGGGEPVELE